MSFSYNQNKNQTSDFQDELLKLLDIGGNGKDEDMRKLLSKLDSFSNREKSHANPVNNNAARQKRAKSLIGRNQNSSTSQLRTSKECSKIYDRSYKFEEQREEKIQNMKMNLMMDQLQVCTHIPKINNNNGKKAEKNIIKRTEEIIYRKQEKIRRKREENQKKEEEELDFDCTFKPTINKTNNGSGLVKTKRDVSDLMAWKKQKDDRLFDSLLEKSKREQQQTTFVPNISDKSKKMIDNKFQKDKKSYIEDSIYEQKKSHTITPSLNKNSSQKGYSPINSFLNKSSSCSSTKGYTTNHIEYVEITKFPSAIQKPSKVEYESINPKTNPQNKNLLMNTYATVDLRPSPVKKTSARIKPQIKSFEEEVELQLEIANKTSYFEEVTINKMKEQAKNIKEFDLEQEVVLKVRQESKAFDEPYDKKPSTPVQKNKTLFTSKDPRAEIEKIAESHCGLSEINSSSKDYKKFENIKQNSKNYLKNSQSVADCKAQKNLFEIQNDEEPSPNDKLMRRASKEKYLTRNLIGNYSTNEFKDLEEMLANDQIKNAQSPCENLNYKLLDEINCSKPTKNTLQQKSKHYSKKEIISNPKNLPPKCLSNLHYQSNQISRQMSKSSQMNKTMEKEICKIETQIYDSTVGNNSVRSKSVKRNSTSNFNSKQYNSKKNLNVASSSNMHLATARPSRANANCIYKSPIQTRSRAHKNNAAFGSGTTSQKNIVSRSNYKMQSKLSSYEIKKNTVKLDGFILKPIECDNGNSVYVIEFEESKSNFSEIKKEKIQISEMTQQISNVYEAMDNSEQRSLNLMGKKESLASVRLDTDNQNKKTRLNSNDNFFKSMAYNEDTTQENYLSKENPVCDSKKSLLKDFESSNNFKTNEEQKNVNEARYCSFAPYQNCGNGYSTNKSQNELSHSPQFLSGNSNKKTKMNSEAHVERRMNKENKAPIIESVQVVEKKVRKTQVHKVSQRPTEKVASKSNLKLNSNRGPKPSITKFNNESNVLRENTSIINKKDEQENLPSFRNQKNSAKKGLNTKHSKSNKKVNLIEQDRDDLSNSDLELSIVDSNFLSMKFCQLKNQIEQNVNEYQAQEYGQNVPVRQKSSIKTRKIKADNFIMIGNKKIYYQDGNDVIEDLINHDMRKNLQFGVKN